MDGSQTQPPSRVSRCVTGWLGATCQEPGTRSGRWTSPQKAVLMPQVPKSSRRPSTLLRLPSRRQPASTKSSHYFLLETNLARRTGFRGPPFLPGRWAIRVFAGQMEALGHRSSAFRPEVAVSGSWKRGSLSPCLPICLSVCLSPCLAVACCCDNSDPEETALQPTGALAFVLSWGRLPST